MLHDKNLLHRSKRGEAMLTAFSAAVRGTILLIGCGARIATGTTRTGATTMLVFVLLLSRIMISIYVMPLVHGPSDASDHDRLPPAVALKDHGFI